MLSQTFGGVGGAPGGGVQPEQAGEKRWRRAGADEATGAHVAWLRNAYCTIVALQESKYRLRNIHVIRPDKPVIKNFITQSDVVKGLQQCKGRDWFDYISALPLLDMGLLDEVTMVNGDDLILEGFKCMKDNKLVVYLQ